MVIMHFNYFFSFLKITHGTPYLEMKIFYTPSDIFSMARLYGEAGRLAYIRNALTFDILVPFFAAALLLNIYVYLARKDFDVKGVKIAMFIALCACFSDWFENIFLVFTLMQYPGEGRLYALIAGVMTILKYFFMVFIFMQIFLRSRKNMFRSSESLK